MSDSGDVAVCSTAATPEFRGDAYLSALFGQLQGQGYTVFVVTGCTLPEPQPKANSAYLEYYYDLERLEFEEQVGRQTVGSRAVGQWAFGRWGSALWAVVGGAQRAERTAGRPLRRCQRQPKDGGRGAL